LPVCIFIFRTATLQGFLTAVTAVLGTAFVDGVLMLAAIYGVAAMKFKRIKMGLNIFGTIVLCLFGTPRSIENKDRAIPGKGSALSIYLLLSKPISSFMLGLNMNHYFCTLETALNCMFNFITQVMRGCNIHA
jgi:threonine/homoserine/homoserine lactone efflux protein